MYLASLRPGAADPYVLQVVLRLHEPIAPEIFLRGAADALRRHAGFMAKFSWRDGELWQTRTAKSGAIERRTVEQLEDFLRQDRARGLRLGDEPPWRATLLTLTGANHILVITAHHIVLDSVSIAVAMRDVFANYDRARTEQESLPEASPDFLDCLAWRAKFDVSQHALRWREILRAPFTALPEVRGMLAVEGATRACVPITSEMDRALRELAGNAGITLNTLVNAAVALWLARTTDSQSVVLATMREARRFALPGSDEIAGPMVNTLPLSLAMPDGINVRDWLRDVRARWVAQRELEHGSLAQMAEWVGFDPGAPPLIINFQRARLPAQLARAGFPPHRCDAELVQTTDVPIMVGAFATPRLEVEISWQESDGNAAVAAAMARGLQAIFEAFVRDPEQNIGAINILGEEDEAMLAPATFGPRAAMKEALGHERIEQQIRARPDAIAFREHGRDITYREFGERAEIIGANVRRRFPKEEIITVVLPQGAELACVVLGILRSGAAFFLLNPNAPAAERHAIFRRLPVTSVITDDALLDETCAVVANAISYREIASAMSGAVPPPRRARGPGDLCYLVHTSGSTGDKKFIETEHFPLANTIAALTRAYAMNPADIRIARAQPGNDYWISEIFFTLSAGATLFYPEETGPLTLADFNDTLRREKISVAVLPTSYWQEWAREFTSPDDIPPGLRLVVCTLEKANAQMVAKWLRLTEGRAQWLNVYGPAEVAIVTTIFDPCDGAAPDDINVPIGRPLPNYEVYVLDAQRRRLPPGITGEIAIAGVGVARGYRGQEEMTAQKFVANPHSAEFARLYLSGDYGYVDARGQIVFVGRRDQQVKISGHRVELGEVEVALEEHLQIQSAIVTLEGEETASRLVAHLVPAGAFEATAFRNWMAQRLPAHLRPSDVVTLPSLPIMPAGKVDRRALSAAYRARAKAATVVDDSPDATPTEKKLLRLWRELFGEQVVITLSDNFFDLGGNSLLAVRMISRLEREFGLALSLHELFTHPTIALLALRLERDDDSGDYTSLLRLNAECAGVPLFTFHGWSGGVFHFFDFARALNGHRPVVGLQAIEHGGCARHRTFEEMARHYADEMVRAHPGQAYELFGHSLGGMVAYATACELLRRGQRVRCLYIVDTTPLNLPRGVHVRRTWQQIRPRLLPHFGRLLLTPGWRWPRYLRHRRRALESRLRKWPALANPELEKLPPDFDYYATINREFFPERQPLEVELFTPHDATSTSIYWRYLVGARVHDQKLPANHVDMFVGDQVKTFLPAFLRAEKRQRARSAGSAS